MPERLNQIGEREIINRLKRFMPKGQIEDDTAEINPFNKNILINSDVLVENVHFSEETTSAEDVGWRAVATNLSDLAASGVEQILGITVGLISPSSTTWDWVEDVYTGMEKALDKFGGNILGGDCSSGQQKVIAITAIGTVGPLRLHRSNAREGDYLVTSGPHGLSRLGLELLLSKDTSRDSFIPDQLKQKAIQAHQRPEPPIKALRILKNCKPKNISWRAAGTDSSDGLIDAIQNICDSSNCQAVLDANNLPKDHEWPNGSTWDNWCMNGGEDFELVLSLPPSWAKALLLALPSSRLIGVIKSGQPKVSWNHSKDLINVNDIENKHF